MLPLQQRFARESVALALNFPMEKGFKGVEKATPREPFDHDYAVRPTFGLVVGEKNSNWLIRNRLSSRYNFDMEVVI